MIKVSETEKRALKTLLSGPVVYEVHGSKAVDWPKAWKFNMHTLRALKELDLADYNIYAACQRHWTLTEEGTKLCTDLRLQP